MLTVASGLISLIIGSYVYINGRRKLVNILFFFITICMALWAFSEAMTAVAVDLNGKIFWTRFQVFGEALLIPTYLLIALYFPERKGFMGNRRAAAAIISAIYAPFILTIILLYTTDLVYSGYYLSQSASGVSVVRTTFFWVITSIGFAMILATMAIYLWERHRNSSRNVRMGLLIMALAPLPMLVANLIQNLKLSANVSTIHAGLLFIALIAFGIMRYGIFVDIRSITKRLLVHAAIIFVDTVIFTLICALYIYVLDLGRGIPVYALFVLTGIPFLLAYPAEVDLLRKIADRYFSGRELKESRLLQELSRSIRTVSNLQDLVDSVVIKVRESLSLTACALMVKEEDIYRAIGYTYKQDPYAIKFKSMVKTGAFLRKWDGWFALEDEEGTYSGYWQVGERIDRGELVLSRINRGILRIHHGGGEVEERLWPEEDMGESISVPLEVGGEEVGFLWMMARPVRFSLQELDFIVALSTQVAVSLKNSQLLQELLDKSARLQQLIQRATTAQEEERMRISRELHDGLAPYFLDIIFKLEMLEGEVGGNQLTTGLLDEVRNKAREGVRDLRKVITDLRPSSLDVLGLRKSLATYLERFGIENGVEVEFQAWGDLGDLDPLIEVTMFRVAQETLSNIARHAHASKVRFSLGGDNGCLEMTVEDDGVGFLEREIKRKMLTGECLGIKGMSERAELMRGDLSIESRPGNGTRVRFSVPLTGV